MKAASSIQGNTKISVTKYQIEKLQDSNGRERKRLLIARDGEQRGAIVIDTDEEGEEIDAERWFGRISPAKMAKTSRICFTGRTVPRLRQREACLDGTALCFVEYYYRRSDIFSRSLVRVQESTELDECRGRDLSPRPSGAAMPSPDILPGRL